MQMDEPVQVEAVRDGENRLTPKTFIWRGQSYVVDQIGRRWEQDGWSHVLVMSPDGQTWDLAHSPKLGVWRVRHHTSPHGASVT